MEVSKHDPGTFCWIELATSDRKAAVKFYGDLFGWTAREFPMDDGNVYVIGLKKGKDAAGIYETKDAPPNWLSYVCVTSADEAAAKAKKLGGHLMMDAFDVMDIGRMAMIIDPQVAPFAVWQPKKHIGVGIMNEHGTLGWNELQATDPDAARKFYTSLFGWGAKVSPEYTEWTIGGRSIGGMMKSQAPGAPSHWLVYFVVDDCDASTKKAQSLGARTHVPPMDIANVGRFSVVADPQGAFFAMIKMTSPM